MADPRLLATGVLLLPVGLMGTGCFVWLAFRGARSSRWPTTGGRIILAERALYTVGRRLEQHLHVAQRVEYLYVAANRELRGSRISVLDTSRHLTAAGPSYSVGDPVQISYNPANPSDALLQPGVPGDCWIGLLISLAALAGGVAILFFRPA